MSNHIEIMAKTTSLGKSSDVEFRGRNPLVVVAELGPGFRMISPKNDMRITRLNVKTGLLDKTLFNQ